MATFFGISVGVGSGVGVLVGAAHAQTQHRGAACGVVARDASDVVVGAARLGLDFVLAPLVGFGLDKVVDGYVLFSDVGVGYGQRRGYAFLVVGDNFLGFGVVDLVGCVVFGVGEERGFGGLVDERARWCARAGILRLRGLRR